MFRLIYETWICLKQSTTWNNISLIVPESVKPLLTGLQTWNVYKRDPKNQRGLFLGGEDPLPKTVKIGTKTSVDTPSPTSRMVGQKTQTVKRNKTEQSSKPLRVQGTEEVKTRKGPKTLNPKKVSTGGETYALIERKRQDV